MNSYEFILYFLILIHLFIWIFSLLSGFFGIKFIIFNLYILLPLIYLFQYLPFHKIVELKLRFIKNNIKYFNQNIDNNIRNEYYNYKTKCNYDYFSKILNINNKELLQLYDILYYYENNIFIIYYFEKLKNKLNNTTFSNPLSPQGLIILSFITNLYIAMIT